MKDRLMKPLRRPAAAITQQRAGLTMMARESKKEKKESDKKSTNRRKKRSHERGTGIEIEDASAYICVPCVLISQQLQLPWLTTPIHLYTYRSIPQKHDPVHQVGVSISFMLEDIKVNDISSWLFDVHTLCCCRLLIGSFCSRQG